jgi:glycosyltransferase involved in cell wall biosynthesis
MELISITHELATSNGGRMTVARNSPMNKRELYMEMAPHQLPEILFVCSYPPRECGIATYSQDLRTALSTKFGESFAIRICALESGETMDEYPEEVDFRLDTTDTTSYHRLAKAINASESIQTVMIQHEFGLFGVQDEGKLLNLLNYVTKPIVLAFHTVLPKPNPALKTNVRTLVFASETVVVMTHDAANILSNDYDIPAKKIKVIAHGTHLVHHLSKTVLKEKHDLTNRKVLSTFGLLSSGKGIETTLQALPSIIQTHPDVLFLIIGKTHPTVVKSEGEAYRDGLETMVKNLGIEEHVKFINAYLSLPLLLEYLQLTDIYLFTSKDPTQAVSGTFAYAMSCACPIISTPIPHATEVLSGDTGVVVDFQHPIQLAHATIRLLNDENLRTNIGSNTLQKSVATAWENSAVAHANLLEKITGNHIYLSYHFPPINLEHFRQLTSSFGMIQFSKVNQPDIDSGYTLDDNARALIATCMHFDLTQKKEDLDYIHLYLDFIGFCVQKEGYFLNYVDENKAFTPQNESSNLADSNGRAIWALGYLISKKAILPLELIDQAESIMHKVLTRIEMLHSTRAMSFAIKGLYYSYGATKSPIHYSLITVLANRLMAMYKHESKVGWEWYESYLTYGNSVLPEAMLMAWMVTAEPAYKEIAKASFDFLLKNTFNEEGIQVISNRSWWQRGQTTTRFGEQPIEITYTILALAHFKKVFADDDYYSKMETAFSWFLGKNHLGQIIYNPCTGGCYDGLEETQVNLNQGAESTVCYLIARLTMEENRNQTMSIDKISL